MKKVLVVGANGLLGTDVWKVFSEAYHVVAMGRTQPVHVPLNQWRVSDLRNASEVYATITKENPDIVINCASYNNVDGAESDRDEAYRVNATGVRNLALACQRFDTVLLTVSTDYVFDGIDAPAAGYQENDVTRPISIYGESKRWGEVFTEQLLSKFYIVRTSFLFGSARPTYADKIVEWARNKQPIPCLKDSRNAPTYTPDLANALKQLAESGLYGTYHLTNSGFCSRVEFAQEVLRLHKLPETTLKPLTQPELKMAARRPVFSGLQNSIWRLNGFTPLRSWQEAVKEHFALNIPSR